MQKFKLSREEYLSIGKHQYHRIIALQDFSDVKKGDRGGWVTHENCLSQNVEDLCWIYDNARISGGSQVLGNATIRGSSSLRGACTLSGEATIEGNVRVIGSVHIDAAASLIGDIHIVGIGSITGNAKLRNKIYINGNFAITENAYLSSGAVLFGDCYVGGDAAIAVELTDCHLDGQMQLFSNDDFIVFKGAGPDQLPLVAYRQQGGLEPIIHHGDWYLPLSKFETEINRFFNNKKSTHIDADYSKLYSIAIKYVRDTLVNSREDTDGN